MLTPPRRVGISIGAAAAIASGGSILFWIGGFLSFFVVDWLRANYGSGGMGAVSVGVPEFAVLLLAAFPVCMLLNRRLRAWAGSRPGRSLRIHRLHTLALWAFFVLIAIAVVVTLAGRNDMFIPAAFGFIVAAMVAYGFQFLLLGVLLGLYAAASDPDAAHP